MPSTVKLFTSKAPPPAPSKPPAGGCCAVSPSAGGCPRSRLPRRCGSSPENVMFVSESAADAAATPSTPATVSSADASNVVLPKPAVRRDWLSSVESSAVAPSSAPNSNRPGPAPASPSSGGAGSCDDGEVGADAVDGLEHRRLRVAHAGGDGVHDHDERDRERHADRDDRGLPPAPGELAPEVGEEHGSPRRSGEAHRAGRRSRR